MSIRSSACALAKDSGSGSFAVKEISPDGVDRVGVTCVGEFKGDKQHGQGTLTDVDGKSRGQMGERRPCSGASSRTA